MPPHIVSAEEVVIFNICVVSLYSATKFLLELPSKILVILVLLLLASVSINIRYKNGISIDVDPYIIITEKLDLFNISLNKYSEILLESINVLLFHNLITKILSHTVGVHFNTFSFKLSVTWGISDLMFSTPPLVLLDDLLTTTEKPMFLTLSVSIPA